jgi:protein-tyrosine-phosphatase
MKILLVCSGNTCRSPLAAAMLSVKLRETPDLVSVQVSSAGTSAWERAPASEGAYLIALERGLDLSSHRARMLTAALVEDADLILAMSEAHARRVEQLGGVGKTFSLGEYAGLPEGQRDVHDPMGGDVAGYRETATVLDDLLTRAVNRLNRGNRA